MNHVTDQELADYSFHQKQQTLYCFCFQIATEKDIHCIELSNCCYCLLNAAFLSLQMYNWRILVNYEYRNKTFGKKAKIVRPIPVYQEFNTLHATRHLSGAGRASRCTPRAT